MTAASLLWMVSPLQASERPAISVFAFEDFTAPARADSLVWQKLFALLLTRTLETTDEFSVSNRTQTQEVLDRGVLSGIGIVAPDSATRLLEADFIVMGDFSRLTTGQFIISVRLTRAHDGSLVRGAADNRELALADLCQFAVETSLKITSALGKQPSKAVHKRLNRLCTRDAAALTLLGESLVARQSQDYERALTLLDSAETHDSKFDEIATQKSEVTALLELQRKLSAPEKN